MPSPGLTGSSHVGPPSPFSHCPATGLAFWSVCSSVGLWRRGRCPPCACAQFPGAGAGRPAGVCEVRCGAEEDDACPPSPLQWAPEVGGTSPGKVRLPSCQGKAAWSCPLQALLSPPGLELRPDLPCVGVARAGLGSLVRACAQRCAAAGVSSAARRELSSWAPEPVKRGEWPSCSWSYYFWLFDLQVKSD